MTPSLSAPDSMSARIDAFFEENFAALKAEGGHTLTPEVKETARLQVQMYWRKLQGIAERVTDTEVRLALPQQQTPQGRTFAIEGVVDIVRQDDAVIMYDLKTHAAAAIRGDIEAYERQLNVYAHIWQNLRGQRLDGTGIICTQLPEALRQALVERDAERADHELGRWNPLIDVPFEPEHVAATVRAFGGVVDCIENGEFAPAPLERLYARQPGTNRIFATDVCRNCDARFSCASYHQYARESSRAVEQRFAEYFDDFGDDETRTERILAAGAG